MDFLTPLGALIALLVVAPVAAFVLGEHGRRRRLASTRCRNITASPRRPMSMR